MSDRGPLGRTSSRARWWPALLLVACEPLPPEVAIDCVRHDHCDAGEVCFLSKCVDPGLATASLYIDVVPSNTSGFLPQVASGPRDLFAGLIQDIELRRPHVVTGAISADGSSVSGLLRVTPVLLTNAPALPSATNPFKALADTDGFDISLHVGSSYSFSLTPEAGTSRPPYPWAAPIEVQANVATVNLTYPAADSLVRMSGIVISDPITRQIKESVVVEGIGNPTGAAPTRSTVDTTDSDGRYTLVFLPGTTTFRIKVRPGTNSLVPTAERDLAVTLPPGAVAPGELEPFSLDLAAGIGDVTVSVRSPAGDPVAGATVTFQGITVGVGTFTASGETGVNSTVQVTLLRGLYDVVVSPETTGGFAQISKWVCVAEPGTENTVCQNPTVPVAALDLVDFGQTINISVGEKVTLRASLSAVEGAVVRDARVIMRLQNAKVGREFVGTTGPGGQVDLEVDPGTATTPAIYDLIVEPQQRSTLPLPLHSEEVEVSDAALQEIDVVLREAALVHGRVLTPNGTLIADVRVGYYSVELGSLDAPLLVGLGQTNEEGEYVIPIPAAESQ